MGLKHIQIVLKHDRKWGLGAKGRFYWEGGIRWFILKNAVLASGALVAESEGNIPGIPSESGEVRCGREGSWKKLISHWGSFLLREPWQLGNSSLGCHPTEGWETRSFVHQLPVCCWLRAVSGGKNSWVLLVPPLREHVLGPGSGSSQSAACS